MATIDIDSALRDRLSLIVRHAAVAFEYPFPKRGNSTIVNYYSQKELRSPMISLSTWTGALRDPLMSLNGYPHPPQIRWFFLYRLHRRIL